MTFFSFLKSQNFWLGVAHFAIIAAGAYTSYAAGNPLPLVISGAVNAFAPSPLPAPKG